MLQIYVQIHCLTTYNQSILIQIYQSQFALYDYENACRYACRDTKTIQACEYNKDSNKWYYEYVELTL